VPYYDFIWNDDLVRHLEEHGVSVEDFEQIVTNPEQIGESRSTGRPCCWGETADGRFLFCVFEKIEPYTILPVTAFETRRHGT
jgi:uncharacterized DUF497 family protein